MQTARQQANGPQLVNRDMPTIIENTRYGERSSVANRPLRPAELLWRCNNNQQPVGESVPSQTVFLKEHQYSYVLQTKGDEQATSERIRELVNLGIEVEQDG